MEKVESREAGSGSVASVAPFAVITLLMANTVKTAQQQANAQWRRSMPPSCRRSKTTAMGRAISTPSPR